MNPPYNSIEVSAVVSVERGQAGDVNDEVVHARSQGNDMVGPKI